MSNPHIDIISRLPADVRALKVEDASGNIRWRPVHKLLRSDIIQLTKEGRPFMQRGVPGRKAHIPKKYQKSRKFPSSSPPPPPSKVESPSPAVPDDIEISAGMRETFIAKDPLSQVIRESPDSTDVLQEVMSGLAEESASIAFDRMKEEKKGRPTSVISTRRIQGLKALADTWLKRKEQLDDREIDLGGPGFQNLWRFLMTTFRNAMLESNLTSESIQHVMTTLGRQVDDDLWVVNARKAMRGDMVGFPSTQS